MRAAGIIIQNKQVLLIHRIKPSWRREKLGQAGNYYILPGGQIEHGETPEEATVRELKEELCIDASIDEKLWEIMNLGAKEIYFLVTTFKGEPKLAGEDNERLSDVSATELVLVSREELENTDLRPKVIKDKLLKYLSGI